MVYTTGGAAYKIRFNLSYNQLLEVLERYAYLLEDSQFKEGLALFIEKVQVSKTRDYAGNIRFNNIYTVIIIISSKRLSKKMIKKVMDYIPYLEPKFGQDRN